MPEFTLDQDFPDLGKLRYRIGHTRSRLVLCEPLPGTPDGDRFNERRIGLDHIAIGVLGGRESVEQLEIALRRIGADTDGVKLDRAGKLAMISFRDPDNFPMGVLPGEPRSAPVTHRPRPDGWSCARRALVDLAVPVPSARSGG